MIGSGILDQLGMRRSSDVDLVVSSSVFADMASDERWQACKSGEETYFRSGEIEAWSDWYDETGWLGYDQLLGSTEVHDGVRFMSLDFMERWKRWKGREKDMNDLELIRKYREAGL